MGFSVAASLGSYVVLRGTSETRINCQSFCRIEQNNIGFKFSKQRAIKRGTFISKKESIEFDERKSPHEVREEIKQCYELINELGRGVVYLGSSRMGRAIHITCKHKAWLKRQIANLLDCTSWSGAGPGLMDAVTQAQPEPNYDTVNVVFW